MLVILSLRRIRDSDARNKKLDRSFVAVPCAKRACERSTRACPARSEPASGAHGFLLRMTVRLGQTRSQTSRSTNNFAENVQVTAREHVAIVVLLGKGATSPTQLGAELRIGAQVFDRACQLIAAFGVHQQRTA